jgi:ubiquitin carboxyl-terminal hydrolase 36/42
MKGISNIGNSCYLNSALQLLFNSNDFCKLITGNTELYNDMKSYHSSTTNLFNPRNIKSIVDSKTKQFRGATQQDSSEFILYIFDIISQYNKEQDSNLYDLFGIKTDINIKCKLMKCLHESSHVETDLLLFLPITDDLSTSYREYKSIEKLENENAYQCDKCKDKTIARKKLEIIKWPQNLIIVLKRFDSMMRKNEQNVKIPIDWRHDYVLHGGIIHMGSFGGGHYIYYGYNKSLKQWFIANDGNISIIIDINTFLEKNIPQSYILYYEKNINLV